MNDKFQYDFDELTRKNSVYSGDYLSSKNQELRTKQNVDTIEKLFDEWDENDKNSSDDFSLKYSNEYVDDSLYQSNPIFREPSMNDTQNIIDDFGLENSNNSSFYDYSASNDLNSSDIDDPMEKTREISSITLDDMKALQEQLHKLYDEQDENLEPEEPTNENDSQLQKNGKSLVKATRQGIAFSNGSLTKTFLDCAILCFVTASFGCGMLMYIINHI